MFRVQSPSLYGLLPIKRNERWHYERVSSYLYVLWMEYIVSSAEFLVEYNVE